MTSSLYLPTDAVTGRATDFDLAADFLELAAFFSADSTVATSDLANTASIAAAEDHDDLEDEIDNGEEEIVSGAVNRLDLRARLIGRCYPFALDDGGDILTCTLHEESFGQAAYALSLVLSNLESLSPILSGSPLHPANHEVRKLREYFQYFATAALAAEVSGDAWSFGFPRPDHSPFLDKLQQVWGVLCDGRVDAQIGAPTQPKDDQVDVFAARLHHDMLPGFPLAAAQVATGKNPAQKSLKGHLSAFKSRWFSTQPVTEFIAYMIVPFAIKDSEFVDDVRTMGNVLHRLRVPRRVAEANQLVTNGRSKEGYEHLSEAARWVAQYRLRGNTSA
ncbi:MAG: hypothetical protein OXH96_23290 [Spirochaetaceae bacterium]|nr:hypothetical protein [Spirochaetaceae bacterium]